MTKWTLTKKNIFTANTPSVSEGSNNRVMADIQDKDHFWNVINSSLAQRPIYQQEYRKRLWH